MTLGELKKYAAQLIDEYSNNSDITSDDDIRLKLNSLFNIAQFELCQLKKINSSISIIQDIPQNTISPKINTNDCLLYTSPSPRDSTSSRMPSSA